MNRFKSVKDKLYELLLSTCDSEKKDSGDVNISQKLDIAMTNAVKRGGVVNIINQSIAMYKIVPKIVEVIKDVDELEYSMVESEPVPLIPLIEHIGDPLDPVENCCKYFFERGTTWDHFKNTMRAKYIDYVRRQFNTTTETSDFLNVNPSVISRALVILRNDENS